MLFGGYIFVTRRVNICIRIVYSGYSEGLQLLAFNSPTEKVGFIT